MSTAGKVLPLVSCCVPSSAKVNYSSSDTKTTLALHSFEFSLALLLAATTKLYDLKIAQKDQRKVHKVFLLILIDICLISFTKQYDIINSHLTHHNLKKQAQRVFDRVLVLIWGRQRDSNSWLFVSWVCALIGQGDDPNKNLDECEQVKIGRVAEWRF